MSTPLFPKVTWAERQEDVFVTIDLPDVKDENLDLQETSLTFTGNVGEKKYAFALTFPEKVDTTKSKLQKSRLIHILLHKVEPNRWHKLTTDSGKHHWLTCDWSRWVDTDDEKSTDAAAPYGDMDFSQFNQFGNFDYPGMYDEEDDEERDESEHSDDAGELGTDPTKTVDDIESNELDDLTDDKSSSHIGEPVHVHAASS